MGSILPFPGSNTPAKVLKPLFRCSDPEKTENVIRCASTKGESEFEESEEWA